jgi:RNA polymerase sigma-70 factor, ECF subfamily
MRTISPLAKSKKPYLKVIGRVATDSEADIDHLLNQVIKHNDYTAFEKLFLFNYTPLLNFCKKLVHVNEVAEELVSEVFLKIWNNRNRIVITSSPKSYLYTAVRNISFDHLRREKRSIWVNLDEVAGTPCSNFDPQQRTEFEELQARIDVTVARLPKQCRLVFQLSRDQGMKYNEIAETLHLSVKTIETQMGRALKVLRKSINKRVDY